VGGVPLGILVGVIVSEAVGGVPVGTLVVAFGARVGDGLGAVWEGAMVVGLLELDGAFVVVETLGNGDGTVVGDFAFLEPFEALDGAAVGALLPGRALVCRWYCLPIRNCRLADVLYIAVVSAVHIGIDDNIMATSPAVRQ
jgi:hypothetical protein